MDTFTFGKYKGKDVKKMCYLEPYYCRWADENVEFFKLTDEQRDIVERRIWEEEDAKAEWAEEHYGWGGNGLWDMYC